MSQGFIGEIRLFGGNFAPVGWAFCNGQIIPISQNSALFNLIGTTYGGDGQSTFALPDLQGRRPVHQGQGPGLSTYVIGQLGGVEAVTLIGSQGGSHSHSPQAVAQSGTVDAPAGNVWAQWSDNPYATTGSTEDLAANAIGQSGGNQPHENRSPFLVVSYIIALYGIYPTQT